MVTVAPGGSDVTINGRRTVPQPCQNIMARIANAMGNALRQMPRFSGNSPGFTGNNGIWAFMIFNGRSGRQRENRQLKPELIIAARSSRANCAPRNFNL
jgi:hypothetical protein